MNACDLLRRLHQHRRWANRKLLAAAESLSDDQLKRPCNIGQGSIWKSLTHLYAAEYVWLEALEGNESPLAPGDRTGGPPGNQEGPGAATSVAQLAELWNRLDEHWSAWLGRLNDEALDRMVFKVSTSSGAGRRHATRCSDVLLHVCTHAQYTAAQAVNMLRQCGATALPDVMLISLARAEAASDP